jgi:hypothetical protein
MEHFIQRVLKYLVLLALQVIVFFFSFYLVFFISRLLFVPLQEKYNFNIGYYTQSIKALVTVIFIMVLNIMWATKTYLGKTINKVMGGTVSGSIIIIFYLLQPHSFYPVSILFICQMFLWESLDALKVLRMKYY